MKYILMSARTNSEWDSTEFALVEITPERIKYFKSILSLAGEVSDSHGVNQVSVYDDSANFYLSLDELEGIEVDSNNDFKPFIIELASEEGLTRPENKIRNGEIKFTHTRILFTAYGAHTDEEFWCDCGYEVLDSEEVRVCSVIEA